MPEGPAHQRGDTSSSMYMPASVAALSAEQKGTLKRLFEAGAGLRRRLLALQTLLAGPGSAQWNDSATVRLLVNGQLVETGSGPALPFLSLLRRAARTASARGILD